MWTPAVAIPSTVVAALIGTPSFRERGGGGRQDRVDGDLICDDTEEEARLAGWRLLAGWLIWILVWLSMDVTLCSVRNGGE